MDFASADHLTALMAENEKLHHRAARLQKRVYTLVGRMAGRAASRRQMDTKPETHATTH